MDEPSGAGPRYRRILLKLSGEALAGEQKFGIVPGIVSYFVEEMRRVINSGVTVAVVIGAGNIFRGIKGDALGIDRSTADNMGMLATVMNSLALGSALENAGVPARVMSAVEMDRVAETYTIPRARKHLQKGRVVIVAGGTGHPYFTTDTAASLRAIELGADVLLKATRVDGVYTADPEKDPTARKIDSLSFIEVLQKQLRVMDLTSVSLCMENRLPIIVFDLMEKGSMEKIISGASIGTLIS